MGLAPHGLHWCPEHQLALTHTLYDGWHWTPFTTATLAIAQAYARYFGYAEPQGGRTLLELAPVPSWSELQYRG